jgi:glucosamine-phosphate N-acetyltransferase
MTSKAAFSSELVPTEVQKKLPDGYVLRPLQRDDHGRGQLEPLRDLTHVGEITEEQWIERFDWMVERSGTYYTVVIVDEARGRGKEIVATGTLFVEKKLCVSFRWPYKFHAHRSRSVSSSSAFKGTSRTLL